MTISTRRQRTRAALQEAALAVFARRGVAGASIEEICEEGGFTRGAFYSNYGTKDDLILEIIDQEFARAVEGASGLITRRDEGEICAAPDAEGDGAEAGTTGGADEHIAVLRRALDEFDLPLTPTPATVIAQRDIELHSLRHPQLRARLDAVKARHTERLEATVAELLSSYGARATVPMSVLIDACHACYNQAAEQAVAAAPDAPTVTIDRSILLAVLVAFIEFPQED